MASKSFKALLPILLIAGSLVIAVVLIASRPENKLQPAVPRSALIDVAEVRLQDLRIPIQAQGTVTPHRDTTLVSQVGGQIVDVSPSFHAGGYVAAGEMMLQIDDRDYQAALLRARSAVATAKSNLAQEKGRAEVARREWERLDNRGSRSQEGKDLYLRKPQLEQAQAQLLSAQADLQKAQDDLERTTIRAPYDALIQEKQADLGKFLSPGTPVARVFAVDYAEVRLSLPQSRLSYLDLPDVAGKMEGELPMVDLYTDVAGDITHWQARLHRTEAALDERSRVLFAVARIDDPYGLEVGDNQPLRVGTFVKANILGREMTNIVPLPRHVLRAGNQVWIVDEQRRLRNRNVTTLRTEGNEIYVTSGLNDGDLVALSTVSGALPGMGVRINSTVSTLRQQESLIEAAGMVIEAPASEEEEATSTPPDQSSADDSNRDVTAA